MGWFSRSRDVVRVNEALAASFQRVKRDMHTVHEWIDFLHKQNEYQQYILQQTYAEARQARKNTPSRLEVKRMVRDEVEQATRELRRKLRRDVEATRTTIKHAVRRELNEYEGWSTIFDHLRHMNAKIDRIAPVHERVDKLEQEVRSLRVPQDLLEKLEGLPQRVERQGDRIQEAFDRLTELNQRSAPFPEPAPQTQTPDPMSNLQRKVLRKVKRNSKEYVKNVMLSIIKKYQRINGLQIKEMVVDEQGLVSKSSLYRLLNELEEEGRILVSQDGKEKIYAINLDEEQKENIK